MPCTYAEHILNNKGQFATQHKLCHLSSYFITQTAISNKRRLRNP